MTVQQKRKTQMMHFTERCPIASKKTAQLLTGTYCENNLNGNALSMVVNCHGRARMILKGFWPKMAAT